MDSIGALSWASPTDPIEGWISSKARCSASRRLAQYASAQITTFAAENGITRSMGLTRIRCDNAMAVGAWIEDRYNRRRRHSSIGQISPVAFEMQHCNQTAADKQAE